MDIVCKVLNVENHNDMKIKTEKENSSSQNSKKNHQKGGYLKKTIVKNTSWDNFIKFQSAWTF